MPIGVSGFAIIATVLAAGVSAYGAVSSANAQSSAAKYQAQVAQNNAQIASQNAAWASQAGETQAAAKEMETRAKIGGIKASQAAAGVDVNSGSAVDVRSSASELGELDAINIRSNAARTAYGYTNQTVSDENQSQLDQYTASNAESAGYINAGATVLGSVGKGYSSFAASSSIGTADGTTPRVDSGGYSGSGTAYPS